MDILLWLIFGGIAGWLATVVTGSDGAYGVLGNIVIGIIGAFIGGWLFGRFGAGDSDADRPSSLGGFVSAVVGAIILIVVLQLLHLN